MLEWRNGRRGRLKPCCPQRACGFESHLEHQLYTKTIGVALRLISADGMGRNHLLVPFRLYPSCIRWSTTSGYGVLVYVRLTARRDLSRESLGHMGS